ncbi:MAG: NAD-dependent epimerase/dehydratase family protein [Planctomycetota bacterium]
MRTLVTGAAGFIGASLAKDRVRRGDDVVVFDRKSIEWPGVAEAHVADLGDEAALKRALVGVDVVQNLAAAHLDQSTPDAEYRRVNVDAVRTLVALAKEAGVRRFVQCSSVGVFGSVEDPPAAEDADKNPASIYENTKLAGERAALEEGGRVGLDVVVVRPAWVYGPGCPRTRRLLRMIAKGRFLYFGSGRILRHPIHIDDMLQGFDLAGTTGPAGAIYNIAGPDSVPLSALVDAAAKALEVRAPRLKVPFAVGWCAAVVGETLLKPFGRTSPITRRSLCFFGSVNSYSIEAARRELGYAPVVGLGEGMKRVVTELGGRAGVLGS